MFSLLFIIHCTGFVDKIQKLATNSKTFPLATMGVLAPVLRPLDPLLGPPSSWAEVTFKHLPQPLRSHIQSFRILGQLLKIPPFPPKNCIVLGEGPRVPKFLGLNPNIFVTSDPTVFWWVAWLKVIHFGPNWPCALGLGTGPIWTIFYYIITLHDKNWLHLLCICPFLLA